MTVQDDWRVSSYSGQEGSCVKVHRSLAAIRDSKDAKDATLTIGRGAFGAFVRFATQH